MVFPEMRREKTHWFLYVLTIFISFHVLVGVIFYLTMASSFINAGLAFYLYSAIVCLVLGYVTGFVLNRITHKNKILVVGGIIPSFLCAFVFFFVDNLMLVLNKQMDALNQTAVSQGVTGVIGGTGMASMFGTPSNPIITAVLIIVFFNLAFIANSLMKEEPKKDFLMYLYFTFVLVILCIGTHYSINNYFGGMPAY